MGKNAYANWRPTDSDWRAGRLSHALSRSRADGHSWAARGGSSSCCRCCDCSGRWRWQLANTPDRGPSRPARGRGLLAAAHFILASAIAAEASEVDIITGTGSARKDGGAPMKSAVRALLAELAASPGSDVVAVFEGRSAFTVHLRPRAASAPAPAPALAPATAPLATSLKPASGKQSFGRRKGSTVSPASNNFDGGDGLDLTSAFVRGVKKPGTCASQVPRR